MNTVSRSRVVGILVLVLVLVLTAGQALAVPVLELALAIDGSGSISAADFTLQQSGYITALTALLPTDGSVAVAVYLFSTGVSTEFPLTTIASAGDKTALLTAIAGMVQPGALTNISGAIDLAAADLGAFVGAGREIIDVSTDGVQTVAGDPVASALAAVAGGVDQVNCLGIGGSADCSFIAGAGAFSLAASGFGDFETAITEKLARELVPEPATLLLLGSGLLGLGFLGRRRGF